MVHCQLPCLSAATSASSGKQPWQPYVCCCCRVWQARCLTVSNCAAALAAAAPGVCSPPSRACCWCQPSWMHCCCCCCGVDAAHAAGRCVAMIGVGRAYTHPQATCAAAAPAPARTPFSRSHHPRSPALGKTLACSIRTGMRCLQQLVRRSLGQPCNEPQLLDQLFGLQMSCLKYSWCFMSVADVPAALESVIAVAWHVSVVCDTLMEEIKEQQQQQACTSSSANSSAGSASSAARDLHAVTDNRGQPAATASPSPAAAQWLALESRCLFVAASAMEAAARERQQSPSTSSCECPDAADTEPDLFELRSDMVQWCKECVGDISGYLDVAGLPADILQQLSYQARCSLVLSGHLKQHQTR